VLRRQPLCRSAFIQGGIQRKRNNFHNSS
jgi:hypothetical protein